MCTETSPEEGQSNMSVKNDPITMSTLEFITAEGTKVRMQVKEHAKVIKAMKKFGLRIGITHKTLRFMLKGKELTGEELAGELDGVQIMVEKSFV